MAISREDLDAFYSEIEAPLYNFALRWTWNPSLAEDLVHDAFIRVWRKRDEVDRATLKGLLYKTVQNLALNEKRKAKLREAVPLLGWVIPERHLGAEGDFVQRENLLELKSALDVLPEELRETLLMCQFSDMSYEEVGAALGISSGTVGSRRNRALTALRKRIKALREEDDSDER